MTEPTLQPPTQPPSHSPLPTTGQPTYPTADQPAYAAPYGTADQAVDEVPQGGVIIRAWQRFVLQVLTLAVTVGVFAGVAKGIRLAAPMFDRDPLSLGNFPFYAGAVVGVIVGGAVRFAVAGWFARRNLRRR